MHNIKINILKKLFFILIVTPMAFISFSCDESIELPSPDLTPPNAFFIKPFDGESVSGISKIQVRSTDNEGMESVVFIINQESVFTDSFPDGDLYEYEWITTDYEEDAYHQISFKARDINENEYSSYSIRAKTDNIDNENPIASIISPFNNQTITGTFDIVVDASDNDSIQFVSYYIDNILIGHEFIPDCTDEISPSTGDTVQSCYFIYENIYTDLIGGNGIHSIHVRVVDMNNNLSTLTPIIITVDDGVDLIPPTGSIVNPAGGLVVSGFQEIEVEANDNDQIQSIKLFVNGELYQIITINPDDLFSPESPYFFNWNTETGLEDQENIISVRLRDQSGNETNLYPITLIVNNRPPEDIEPPSVLILTPSAGETISGQIEIKVLATDNIQVDSVLFIINGLKEHVESTHSNNFFSYLWNTDSLDEDTDHYIAAMAYDSEGLSTISAQITVHLDNYDNILPNGYIQNPVPGQILTGITDIEIFAEDNIGVEQVEIFINGELTSTLDNTPYAYEWDTSQEVYEDQYVYIYADIIDLSGNILSIVPIMVYVNNIADDDNTFPTGSISNPISGQTVNGMVSFSVSANDNSGISEVNFLVENEIAFTDNEAPYLYDWDTSTFSSGDEITLSATITDNSDNTTFLQPIIVTIE